MDMSVSYAPRRAHFTSQHQSGFILAYALVSLSGLSMGLLMGWMVWG